MAERTIFEFEPENTKVQRNGKVPVFSGEFGYICILNYNSIILFVLYICDITIICLEYLNCIEFF